VGHEFLHSHPPGAELEPATTFVFVVSVLVMAMIVDPMWALPFRKPHPQELSLVQKVAN